MERGLVVNDLKLADICNFHKPCLFLLEFILYLETAFFQFLDEVVLLLDLLQEDLVFQLKILDLEVLRGQASLYIANVALVPGGLVRNALRLMLWWF